MHVEKRNRQSGVQGPTTKPVTGVVDILGQVESSKQFRQWSDLGELTYHPSPQGQPGSQEFK